MPSMQALQERCGQGVVKAIGRLGGREAVAKRLGLSCKL
jgi:hypothetical protein